MLGYAFEVQMRGTGAIVATRGGGAVSDGLRLAIN